MSLCCFPRKRIKLIVLRYKIQNIIIQTNTRMNHISSRFTEASHFVIKNGDVVYYCEGATYLEKFKNGLPLSDMITCEMIREMRQLQPTKREQVAPAPALALSSQNIYDYLEATADDIYYKEPLKAGTKQPFHKKSAKKNKRDAKKNKRNTKKNQIRQNGYDDKLFNRENKWVIDYDEILEKEERLMAEICYACALEEEACRRESFALGFRARRRRLLRNYAFPHGNAAFRV
jgi:hypothetical protein